MSISYKVRKQTFATKDGKKTVFYAMPISNGETSIEQLQKLISKISAISEGDVRSVLLTLTQLLAIELVAGRRVSLGDLGRMRIGLRSKAAEKAEDFKAQDIRRIRVTFTPGALIRESLLSASVQRHSEGEKPRADKPSGQAEGGGDTHSGGSEGPEAGL
ncbi:MAG: DNA-binding protein [Porphyromonadaceae bacterium]|nr:DNA-binding protein [Porphyromonadaceae bacterium]